MTDIPLLSGPSVPPRSGNVAKQLVVLLHGLGANGDDLIGLTDEFSEVLPEAYFIAPNAPFPCDMGPFGYQWFSLQDWSMGSMLEGAEAAAPILNRFIDVQLAELSLTDASLVLLGFSQGTMMSLHVSLRRKKPCAGVIGYSGAFLDAKPLPKSIVRPPVCLIHGMMDPVVPYIAMQQAESALAHAGVEVETHSCPMLAHGIDLQGIEMGKAFLRRVIE